MKRFLQTIASMSVSLAQHCRMRIYHRIHPRLMRENLQLLLLSNNVSKTHLSATVDLELELRGSRSSFESNQGINETSAVKHEEHPSHDVTRGNKRGCSTLSEFEASLAR